MKAALAAKEVPKHTFSKGAAKVYLELRQARLAVRQLKKEAAHVRAILDASNHKPDQQVDLAKIVTAIVALAQVISEKQFYPYQTAISYRITESVLLHDGEVLTALISRQSGKTQVVGATCAALLLVLPYLATQFPESWHLNITDEKGTYRGFKDGIQIGIYAPRKEQAKIAFDRVKDCFERDTTKQIMRELGVAVTTFNGDSLKLSNGSIGVCRSASIQSKIEGATYHLLVLEEAQDIDDLKVRKSLHPMVSSTMGTIVKVGTSKAERCDFYHAIKANIRAQAEGKKRSLNHFIFPYTICQKYNSRYKDYIEKEKFRIGQDSDEFKMSYGCVWIFERGMFVTQEQLFNRELARVQLQPWCAVYPCGRLPQGHTHLSIVAGIDWGSASDSTVITLVAVDWRNPQETVTLGSQEVELYAKHIVEWREWQGDDYETQFWEIYEFLNRIPKLEKVIMDTNACGRPIYDRFVSAFADKSIEIVPFNFSSQLKSEGYKSFYGDLCGHRFTFPASPAVRVTQEYQRFVAQMLDLRKKYHQGKMIVAHPDEKHAKDDYCDSAMMACYGAATPSGYSTIQTHGSNFFYSAQQSAIPATNLYR